MVLRTDSKIIILLALFIFRCLTDVPPQIIPSSSYAVVDKEYNLTCKTSTSVTEIMWNRQGSYIICSLPNCSGIHVFGEFRANLYNYFCANNTVFTLNIPASDIIKEHTSTWKCISGKTESATFSIYVYHASSEKPQITGYKSLQSVNEGTAINLTCTVSGGYPLTSLSWICGDTIMDSINQSTDSKAKIVLPLFINRTLDKQKCICNGTSPANYSRKSNVTFIVHYPPTVTLISYKEQLPNGTIYNIYCHVEDGNPRSYTITWSQTFANTIVRTDSNLIHLQSNNKHNITLILRSYNDIGEYKCSVTNNVSNAHGNLLQSKSLSIQRNFSAVFVSRNSNVFHAVYDQRLNVAIPFYCQPAIKNISDLIWFKKDTDEQHFGQNSGITFYYRSISIEIPFYQKSVRVDGQVAVMNIKVVSNASEGNYVLRVQNMENVYELFEFKIKVKREVKDPAENDAFIKGPGQQSSLPLILGCLIAGVVIVAVVVVVVLYFIRKRKFNKDKDEKQRLSENVTMDRELHRVSNPYAEVTETNAIIQTARPNSNPYSEPNIGQLALNHDINTTSKDKQYGMAVCRYAATGSVKWLCTGPVNSDNLPTATVSPYAETRIVQTPCTSPIKNGSAQKDDTNAENYPVPIYAEVNKPKKNVNTNSELGAAKDSSDSQKDDSNKVKKSEPVYSEVKKQKPSEKKDEALDSKDQTEQIGEVGAAKDSNDAQKDEIKKPDRVYPEVKKPNPNEKKNEASDSKDQTEQDLIVAENNKFINAVDQDGNRSDSGSDVVPNSTSLSPVTDTVVECEEETKNELNYVELDLSQQSDQKSEIISKGEKVEYAEVKTVA